jgi:site-specific DNA-cytosine methylase
MKTSQKKTGRKIKIIEDTKPLTIAETFVGCGGSHFGFKKSGFRSVFVNDIWDDAIQTLKLNDKDLNESQIICDDIHKIDANYLKNKGLITENLDVFIKYDIS